MRRYVLVAGIAVATLGVVPAHAAGVRYRTVKAPYTTAGGAGEVLKGDTYVQGTRYGSAEVATQRGEYAITVSAVDDHGLPVLFEVTQGGATLGTGCGTTKPLKLDGSGASVLVYIEVGQCRSGVSVPTTGNVTAKLARRTR
jgi:hypothetical protein